MRFGCFFFFPNTRLDMKLVHSSTYVIHSPRTLHPCPIHSSSQLASFCRLSSPLLSSPPCHPPLVVPRHPLVQSLHCQFVALASPSVIDHGGNSAVFAGLEMCVPAGRGKEIKHFNYGRLCRWCQLQAAVM